MPFGDIVIGASTFKPTQPGTYRESTTTYDGPQNELRITGATRTQSGNLVANVRYILEKDVTVGDDVLRKQCLALVEVRVPRDGGFTTTEIDTMIDNINTFLTGDTLNRVLQGES